MGGVTAALTGLTISAGSATDGGGIYNQGTLSVSNCNITDNSVGYSGYGGGIYNLGGDLTLTNSTVANNTTGFYGFGVRISDVRGTLTVRESAITSNWATGSSVINSLTTDQHGAGEDCQRNCRHRSVRKACRQIDRQARPSTPSI